MSASVIFDRQAVKKHRDRASRSIGHVAPILRDAAERLLDRLDDTTHRFTKALDIGGRGIIAPLLNARGIQTISCDLSARMASLNDQLGVCVDEEWLPFGAGSFDLVVANLSLHWVNDLPGTLAQIRHALKPDGLFLASLPVLPTLSELRQALAQAETVMTGGVSPRVSPFPELRDCASLLQRAGFALPVADLDEISITYKSILQLFRDLRDAGETNSVDLREKTISSPALFAQTVANLQPDGGPIEMRLHLAVMTGWAPAQTQPRPLKPGQFNISLEDALKGD